MAKKMDTQFGFVKEEYPIYDDGFDASGVFYVCEKGLVVKYRDKTIHAPFDYVRKIERVNDLPLGKISVIFKIFDLMGDEHDMAVGIADNHYFALRRLCPNALPKN